MAKLIYMALSSLDGYIADENGNFDWAAPDEQVHTFINDLIRPVGTHIYGRGMYEVMSAWETLPTHDEPPCIADFAALWRAADKVVYSSTLHTVSTARTQLNRVFDPETVRQMKSATQQDLSIAGPALAAHAFKAGLIDVCHLFISPVIVGGGASAFPSDIRLALRLQEERRFPNGTVYLQYRVIHELHTPS